MTKYHELSLFIMSTFVLTYFCIVLCRFPYLVSGSESGSVLIRQVDTGEVLHAIDLGSGPVRSISAAPNGNMTVAYGDRYTVHEGNQGIE